MATEHLVPEDLRKLYHVREWRNAAGVISTACPEEWQDIVDVLRAFRLLKSEILTAGGGGGGCPVLTFAITPALYVDDGPAALAAALKSKADRDARRKGGNGRRGGVSLAAGTEDE